VKQGFRGALPYACETVSACKRLRALQGIRFSALLSYSPTVLPARSFNGLFQR
jgi:hypothetical protein